MRSSLLDREIKRSELKCWYRVINTRVLLLLYLSTPLRCYNGYFGQPSVPGGSCQPCHCHGNLDLSIPDSCDPVTGRCLRCRQGYGGADCDSCAEGYYGDAIAARNCQRKWTSHLEPSKVTCARSSALGDCWRHGATVSFSVAWSEVIKCARSPMTTGVVLLTSFACLDYGLFVILISPSVDLKQAPVCPRQPTLIYSVVPLIQTEK